MKKILSQNGFSMIEALAAAGLLGALAVGGMTYFNNQQKTQNYFEFVGKREQLRQTIVGQVLNDSASCRCLFNSAAEFPAAGIAKLDAPMPLKFGRYHFVTPNDCSTATIPAPSMTKDGIDGLKMIQADIKDIQLVGGVYLGNLEIRLDGVKTGLKNFKGIRVQVGIDADPGSTPGMMKFDGCSMSASAAGTGSIFTEDPVIYDLSIPRNSARNLVTPSPNKYSFCSLSQVKSGGNDGGGGDACRIVFVGAGVWRLEGTRGDDPTIVCSMICR